MSQINEALLEMYYHAPIIDAFKQVFNEGKIQFYKPTQQEEGWVGFDQAYAYTNYSHAEFITKLKNSISEEDEMNNFYFGYFLQFKKMEKIHRIVKGTSITIPNSYNTPPYFRFELSTKDNKLSNRSQHETLMLLHNNLKNAHVYYVSPMLFAINSIFDEPNLDDLRMINIDSAPPLSTWDLTKRHFIMFEDEYTEKLYWCSDPIKGKSIYFREWMKKLPRLNSKNMLELINDVYTMIDASHRMDESNNPDKTKKKILPASFTIVEYQSK